MQAGNVVRLRPQERLRHDAEPIAAIYRDLGTDSAEQVVMRALAQVAVTMAGLASQVHAHDMSDLSRHLRRLQRMADNLGMISLALVAGDVRSCLASGDSTAFAAVWARLIRIAEGALSPDKEWLDRSLI
ncbi:MAG: hypothetical protein Q7J44_01445 [Pseudotabrizicola sp.]|uniref:hypothetical protein n=1 Tax=Pseudotabrizicola sp. TaxID=2939647 RepID=UPI00271CD0B1|nr:hypothetical protein [Pseudotabrizicola sp.]MDO9637189.1 hypothetical protein [Pseudotabrizicola sp.]